MSDEFMDSDPHDDLLLTARPTTVVTQHTRHLDNVPDPHGSSEDEEALFGTIGDDNGNMPNLRRSGLAASSVTSQFPSTEQDGSTQLAPAAPASGMASFMSKPVVLIGLALGLGWFLSRKHR